MTLQEILDRIQNVLYQGVDTESQDLDLLRHDLENHIINDLQNMHIRGELWNQLKRNQQREQL